MFRKIAYLFLVYSIFLAGCARQTSPTGGPKDTIPPSLVRSNPANQTVNFSGSSIKFEFSEHVDLNKPTEEIIITPNPGKYEIEAANKTVTLEFKKPLLTNTTYTINLREGVRDITEKNPVRNPLLALSTGPYLDSLTISGTVANPIETTKQEDFNVSLAPSTDTFNIFKHEPPYIVKTNKQGQFRFTNLKQGTYIIYAHKDRNNNTIVDSKNEMYGFRETPLTITSDTANISLETVKLDARPLKLTSARPYNSYYNIKFNKALESKRIAASGQDIYTNYGEDQSTLKIYNTFPDADSTRISLIAKDSIGNKVDTTLYVKFLRKETTPEKFSIAVKSTTINTQSNVFEATITATKPVLYINFDSIYVAADSATQFNINKDHITPDSSFMQLRIKQTLPIQKKQTNERSATKLEFRLQKTALISVESDSSAATSTVITQINPENLSTIIYKATTKKSADLPLIVQLLDKDYRIIRETTKTVGEFTQLPAGDYRLRTIIDTNRNSRWDAGNYFKKTPPERIIYSVNNKNESLINLKASWDYEAPEMLITP